MNTVEQGSLGQVSIVKELMVLGYEVFTPVSDNTSCDLIGIKDGKVFRVECKSTKTEASSISWQVALRQIRPNRSGNTVKKFDATKSEMLAIYVVMEDRVVLFDSKDLHGRSNVTIRKANPKVGDGDALEKR